MNEENFTRMKTLLLTILLEEGMSIADLTNTFGKYTLLRSERGYRYMQFRFSNVKMLTASQLAPVYNLVRTFEGTKPFKFKMFHLHDNNDDSHSPIYIQWLVPHRTKCGIWSMISSTTDATLSSSPNLFALFK